jgi:uncharacterized circularly permuted ATP-grasp superfamily protein/uncharacterized alpha-E superfamily protein
VAFAGKFMMDLRQIPLGGQDVYDETSGDGATRRPHWDSLFNALQSLGSDELARRWSRADRRIRENGITYNIYGDPLGASRPWQIDMLPLLIPSHEWKSIEQGLVQRAELLNRLLADLYGPQEIIKAGRLPAELIFANPEFLRPLAGVQVPLQSHLHLLAVDLARSPDGQWWVLSQRSQSPSGAGYALENRTIVSEALPDVFRQSNVRRLAPFFRAQRDALTGLAGTDNPRIVLLTPGLYNETYFEHSYLARYLGLTLVEGADLTVRDRRVYLKTVHGLQRVDVILRRVDGSFCDPLELRGDSYLGVAGLVDAIAAGNVRVANGLGSGVIETAAILPFLPGLSRHILGERLQLPSVATWWCGQDYALDWVMSNFDNVVVKPAFPSRAMEPVFGGELSSSERSKFADQLRARPYEFVAQEQVALSTAPVWDSGDLHWRSIVLRTYVVNNGDGWTVMPGGLVRVADSDGPVVSMQRGGHSKDAWVLSDEPVDTFSMLRPRNEPLLLQRGSADLPSRVGDNLFWLGRYIERAENIARLLRTLMARVRQAEHAEFRSLLRLYRCLGLHASKLPKKRPPTALELEAEILSVMTDAARAGSLAGTLSEVARVGGTVRERLSTDFSRLIGELAGSIHVEDYMLFVEYSAVLTGCLELLSAVSGMERENITRGPGWLFLSFGRRLERAIYSVRQVREIATSVAEEDWPLLEYVLEVADSSITYRTRYYTTLQPVAVLDVLMCDGTNPRSLAFQLSHVADLYSKLPRHSHDDLHAMRRAYGFVESLDLSKADPQRVSKWLASIEKQLPAWSNSLSDRYFSHARTLPITVGE